MTAVPSIERPCPVCAGLHPEPLLEKGALRLARCRSCGMIFASPVEPRYTDGTIYNELAEPFYLSPDKLQGDYDPVRFQREMALFRRHCPAGEVLDVGCSTGGFLHQLRRRHPGDYRVTGQDVAGAALEYAERQGLPVIRGGFLEHAFCGRQFDAITFWAVLEHLAEPARFLARAHSLLRPGGRCFLLVPSWESLALRVLGGRYRYVMPEHLNYFTSATLQRLLQNPERAGGAWALLALTTTHFNPVVIWQDLRRRPGELVPDADRARLLQKTNRLKNNPLLRPVRWAYGAAEWMLGGLGLADNLVAVIQRSR